MTLRFSEKKALVVEGGAMRSIFSAGLLDGFIESQFNPFDFVIGVSAGSLNLVNYLAGNSGLSLTMYLEAAASKQFLNIRRFLTGGNLIDLDWLYQKLTYDRYSAICTEQAFSLPMYVCVTSVENGEPQYVRLTADNFARSIQASCALPLFFRNFPSIDNKLFADGGISDGIPVRKAIELGATRIMVIRSRPCTYRKTDSLWHKYIRWKMKPYPALVNSLRKRIAIFENSLHALRNPPAGVKITEICPPSSFSSGRFERRKNNLLLGYRNGYLATGQAISDWQQV